MTSAADLKHRASFQKRALDADERPLGPFAEQFTRLADVAFTGLRAGGETVLQGRLQGRAPATMTVRDDRDTRLIDASWRAVIAAGPMAGTYNVRGKAPTHRAGWIVLTVDTGDDD